MGLRRVCQRLQPDGADVNGTYRPFSPHRPVREYQAQIGSEPNGLSLPSRVMDSLAVTITRHLPDEYVVTGETLFPDGRRFLELGVTTAYIEATTDHRWDPDTRRLRVRCPACALWDGRHAKGCTG